MNSIPFNVPFDPFAGLPDDTDPDEVLAIALQEKADSGDNFEFVDCKVLFPARAESRTMPIRLLPGDDVPEDRLPGWAFVMGEGCHFVLMNLCGNYPFFACIGRRESNEQACPSS